MRLKKFNELHTGVETGPEDANFQHQQAGSDIKSSPQIKYNQVSLDNDNITHISQLMKNDTIVYQGSKAIVKEPGEFTIKCVSIRTGKEFIISQGQLEQNGIRVVDEA